MEWISAIGYRMFPLSESGYAGAFQDVMHMVVTAAVVLLSIVSLSMIIAAGAKDRRCRSYGICAGIALRYDARRCARDKARPCRIFRRCGAFQRVCRNRLQHSAGHPPVLYKTRK